MTKLMQWLLAICVFGAFYVSALTGTLPLKLDHEQRFFMMLSPVILVGLFGVYSVITILYRVATFNDCPEAAAELKQEIADAREDLKSKGMKFD